MINKFKNVLRRFYNWKYDRKDYQDYLKGAGSFQKIAANLPEQNDDSLMIISGRGMNVMWAQVWSVFSLAVRMRGYKGLVLTTRKQKLLNKYYKIFNLELIYYDDIQKEFSKKLNQDIATKFQLAESIQDYRNIAYKNIPVGEIAISTFSRYHGTGVIQLDDLEVVKQLREWVEILCQAAGIADFLYKKFNVKIIYVAEIFFEEYGAFYYTALAKKMNVIKFTGTVRDDAFILQHLNSENDRAHHASLSSHSWGKIKKAAYTNKIENDLMQNFLDRYGDKWHRSRRNYLDSKKTSVAEAKAILGVKPGRKVAVVFSHILYDAMFFFGTDLFSNYADWLVETVRVACDNPDLDWLIKVHPSNLWRGELNSLLKGKYEEERLIHKALGELPPHVRIVHADTPINPYAWFQLADYGITVRGTSGLEMAAMGKTTITAGTGRYEGNGFTVDFDDKKNYLDFLKSLPNIADPSRETVELAKKYAYSLFVLKPFQITSLSPKIKCGKNKVIASDDIVYIPQQFNEDIIPHDFKIFSKWALEQNNLELLTEENGDLC